MTIILLSHPDKIDTEAEIGLWIDGWKQRIVDVARGASGETWDDIATCSYNVCYKPNAPDHGCGLIKKPGMVHLVDNPDGGPATNDEILPPFIRLPSLLFGLVA